MNNEQITIEALRETVLVQKQIISMLEAEIKELKLTKLVINGQLPQHQPQGTVPNSGPWIPFSPFLDLGCSQNIVSQGGTNGHITLQGNTGTLKIGDNITSGYISTTPMVGHLTKITNATGTRLDDNFVSGTGYAASELQALCDDVKEFVDKQ